MSLSEDMISRLDMLALLPEQDPERVAFVASLPQADAGVRERWEFLVQENETFRRALQAMPAPMNLESETMIANLLAIPDRPLAVIKKKKSGSIPWPFAAAVIVGVLGVGGYYAWRTVYPETGTTEIASMPDETVTQIAASTLDVHAHPASLDITSNDAAKVTAYLQGKIGSSMPFPVILPTVAPEFHLVGGSVVSMGSGKAVYTVWERDGHRYSLFQFAPANFGGPSMFAKQEVPTTKSLPALAMYRVSLWPGTPNGVCTWVAIGDRNALHDPFSNATY